MRIERIDEKTVKCFLSNQELEEYDIDYKDFIMRSEKAREVVQEIMMLPEQGMILTFSERDSEVREGEQFIECLKEMKKILQRTREKLSQNDDVQEGGKGEADAGSAGEKQQVQRPSFAVFAFSSIGRVMEYAAVLPSNLQVESALYEMNGVYYLYLLKGRASYERYSRACVQALEFAGLYAAEESQALQLKEHGECLINEKAIKKLRG